jgi:hypothetical protein
MNWRKVTKILLVTVAVVLIVYDFFPFFAKERGDTISEVILYYALRCFSLPYTFGVLAGHFFLPRDGYCPQPRILLPLAALVIGIDVLSYVLNIGFWDTDRYLILASAEARELG